MILHAIESASGHCPWSCPRVDIRRRKMLRFFLFNFECTCSQINVISFLLSLTLLPQMQILAEAKRITEMRLAARVSVVLK